MISLFWILVGMILYTYILYPLAILAGARFFPTLVRKDEAQTPSASVIIPAHNEEEILETKIANCLSIDYPFDCIEFLFGSDGSTDSTAEILRKNANSQVKVFLYPERSGKQNVLNKLITEAEGEILVFSDANTIYEPNAIKKLTRHFADPSVGGVCGKLQLVNPRGNEQGHGESFYWQFENAVKKAEGTIHSVMGANGAIYAIRKELYRPLPSNRIVMDDFVIALAVVDQGYRMLYDPDAMATERTSQNMQDEFRRKVRIAAANFNALPHIGNLLVPNKGFIALGLWSHKLIRWSVPFLAISALVTNLFILGQGDIYLLTFAVQSLVYVFAALGYFCDKLFHRSGPFMPFYYLVAMNLAIMLGLWRNLTHKQQIAWERVSR